MWINGRFENLRIARNGRRTTLCDRHEGTGTTISTTRSCDREQQNVDHLLFCECARSARAKIDKRTGRSLRSPNTGQKHTNNRWLRYRWNTSIYFIFIQCFFYAYNFLFIAFYRLSVVLKRLPDEGKKSDVSRNGIPSHKIDSNVSTIVGG